VACLLLWSGPALAARPGAGALVDLMNWIYDAGPYGSVLFVIVTMGLGGAAAFVSGRAMAQTWRPRWHLIPYMIMLAGGVRFIQFAVFAAPLLKPTIYLIDLAALLAMSATGYRVTRRAQMARQYGFDR
jgi:hypothetical protein